MTEKEALEFFEGFIKTAPVNPYTQSAKLAIKALERQIPKKPKNEYTDKLDITTEIPVCPVCGNQNIDETNEQLISKIKTTSPKDLLKIITDLTNE